MAPYLSAVGQTSTGLQAALASRYTIERELGRGGHAVVYLARDLKYNRPVAIKVMLPELAHAMRTESFAREIQISAQLTHPHILTLIDSGEAAGCLYYVMPYVAGESARDRLNREQQLPVQDALRITHDVAEALDYAHRHGVVHRDIKPENILLTDGGGAVVADFGIARALSTSRAGGYNDELAAGTPAYMSPEQSADAGQVDGRSDVYSLGCVLYEMLAGHPPYAGDTAQEVLAHHALDPIPSVRAACPEAPEHVERALRRALAKTPPNRFPDAGAFARALASPGGRWPSHRVLVLSLGAVVIGVGAGARFLIRRAPVEQSVAVLPFVNMSGDSGSDYFSDGMTEDLIGALAEVNGLRVPARTSSFAFKGRNVPVADIGRQLNVAHLVEGSVRRVGRELRVTAQLINVADGYHVWSQHYERELKSARDVFAVQDSIAQAIVVTLQVKLAPGVAALAERPTTENLEAYDLYQQGRYHWYKRTPDETRKAIGYFGQAIHVDSRYALAYSGLADAYSAMGQFGWQAVSEAYPAARRAAVSAVELDSNLAEAWISLAQVRKNDWEWAAADAAFRKGIALNPKYPLGHVWYGRFLSQVMGVVGRSDEGIREGRIAQQLDPLSSVMNATYAEALRFGGRYSEAIKYYRRAITLEPNAAPWRSLLGRAYAECGMYSAALAAFDTAAQLSGGDLPNSNRGWRAFIAAKTGRRIEAEEMIRRLEQDHAQGRVGSAPLGVAYMGLGRKDEAFAAFDQAVEAHALNPSLFLQRQLGSDPRWEALLRKAGVKR